MASTNYKARIIISDSTTNGFSGSYKLLLAAKSLPTPVGTPNSVETTTFENDTQTFVEGVKQSSTKEYTGNLEKEYLDAINAMKGKQVKLIQLYGSDGLGGIAKYAYTGTVVATPSDTSGIDGVLEMTATVTPNTVPELVTDKLTVVEGANGTFTVTVKS